MLKYKNYIFSVLFFVVPFLAKSVNCSTISGTVSFSDASLVDSIIITLGSYYYSNPIVYSEQTDLNFSFDLDPGKYQFSIQSKKSSKYYTNLLIDNNNRNISFEIKLRPKGHESTASVEGFKYHDEYNSLVNDINIFNKNLFSVSPGKATMEIMEKHNLQKTAELVNLKDKYSTYFEQVFIENQLAHLAMHHPLTLLFRKYVSDGEIDSLDIVHIYNSDIFQKYFSKNMGLLRQLDPNSILLDGTFSMALSRMEVFELQLCNDGKIVKDHFYNFLTDFIDKSTNRYCAANLLFTNGEKYKEKNPDRAMFLLTWLEDDYPNYRNVTNGELSKVLNTFKSRKFSMAPDFSVTSISGQTFRLSDYKNKFVFLDFWGTWCSACREEIPNIKKLYDSCSKIDLQIIGLANDKPDILSAYIEKNSISYLNAVANEELLTLYGITGYPTTILVSPDGQIIHKYLRGDNLTEVVKTQIKKYKNEIK